MRPSRNKELNASRTGGDNGAPRTNLAALLRYVGGWLLISAATAGIGLLAVRTLSPERAPLRRIDPIAAVADRCVLQRVASRRPPTTGASTSPARAGVHSHPLRASDLVGALRRGAVVIQYRRSLPRAAVEVLRRLEPVRRLTVIAPDATGMRFVVAGTAWGRLLGCSRIDSGVVAALARFVTRYGGHGPDAVR